MLITSLALLGRIKRLAFNQPVDARGDPWVCSSRHAIITLLALGGPDDSLEIPGSTVIAGQAARSDTGEGPANATLLVTEGEANAHIAGLWLAGETIIEYRCETGRGDKPTIFLGHRRVRPAVELAAEYHPKDERRGKRGSLLPPLRRGSTLSNLVETDDIRSRQLEWRFGYWAEGILQLCSHRPVAFRLATKLRVGSYQALHLQSFFWEKLTVEPCEEFPIINHFEMPPSMASNAVRPRTSRLEIVPMGRSSISAASR